MPNDETERLLVEIGHMLAEDNQYPLDGTLLHAMVDPGMISPSIFKDRGDHILYRDPDLDLLSSVLLGLWHTQEGNDRWAEIEYVVRDGRFHATFIYPDDIDQEESWNDRRRRIVKHHFGDKPVIYPPMSEDDVPAYDL